MSEFGAVFLAIKLTLTLSGFRNRNLLLSCKICSTTLLALFTKIKETKDSTNFSMKKSPPQSTCTGMSLIIVKKKNPVPQGEQLQVPSFGVCIVV